MQFTWVVGEVWGEGEGEGQGGWERGGEGKEVVVIKKEVVNACPSSQTIPLLRTAPSSVRSSAGRVCAVPVPYRFCVGGEDYTWNMLFLRKSPEST